MDTGTSMERGEGWEYVKRLLALARSAPEPEVTAAQRERIRIALVERLAKLRERRLMARAFLAGASSVLVAVVVVKLVIGALPWVERSPSTELAAKSAVQRAVAE